MESFQGIDSHRNIKGDKEEVRPCFGQGVSTIEKNSPCVEVKSSDQGFLLRAFRQWWACRGVMQASVPLFPCLRPKEPFVDQQQSRKYQCGFFLQYRQAKQDQRKRSPL